MELKKCVFCGKSVVPELPHYEIDGISVCYHCGGCKTLFNLAALDVGFSVVMDEPLSVPHIVVENVDGDMVEKAAQSEDKPRPVEVTPEQTGMEYPPNGVIPNCENFPCTECEYHYGELNECMKRECEEK